MRKSELMILAIAVISLAIGAYFYPVLPENMASHWNINGEVDGYMSKIWGVALLPIIIVLMLIMFMIIPKIDPRRANIEKFRHYFDNFIVLISLFLFYIYMLTLAWSLGYRFDMTQLIAPAFGILFFYAGVLTENAKSNWFIGIRTPWTLSSDRVWEKTHKLGGLLFKISGVLAFLGVLFPCYAMFFLLAPVLFAAFYTLVYSYFEYQKENSAKKLKRTR